MTQDHKHKDKALFEELWTNCDLGSVEQFYSPSFICHNPPHPDIQGPEGIKKQIKRTHAAFEDLKYTVEDQIQEGDKTLTRWKMTGSIRTSRSGVVTVTGMTLVEYEGALIREEWTYWNELGLKAQLD